MQEKSLSIFSRFILTIFAYNQNVLGIGCVVPYWPEDQTFLQEGLHLLLVHGKKSRVGEGC